MQIWRDCRWCDGIEWLWYRRPPSMEKKITGTVSQYGVACLQGRDVFQIMPNHMHGILVLTDPVVGAIVGAYKSLVAKACLEIFTKQYPNEMMGKLWQRNYYEHVIRQGTDTVRDEQSYHRIADYIINNPGNWQGDKFIGGDIFVGAGLCPVPKYSPGTSICTAKPNNPV